MNATEYASYDGLGLAALVAGGEVSPQELAVAAMDAHAATDAELRAVIEVYEEGLDRSLGAYPEEAFSGVPFLVKDVGSFAGLRTEFCSRLGQGRIVARDDAYARLIKSSGVNLLGRTTTPEFSMAAAAESVLYGATSKPWRRGYSTNGSSGGSAGGGRCGRGADRSRLGHRRFNPGTGGVVRHRWSAPVQGTSVRRPGRGRGRVRDVSELDWTASASKFGITISTAGSMRWARALGVWLAPTRWNARRCASISTHATSIRASSLTRSRR